MRRMAHLFRTALNVGVNFMSINTFFMALIVFLHWHCCFLFLMPRVYGYVDNRWKSLGVFDMSPAYRYSWGLWAGISNTFSVTSEFEPDIIYELWGHCVLPTLSGLLLATFQGLVSALSAGVESPTGRFRQQVDDVDEYIESKMMDDAMASKIRDYFNFKYRGKIFNQEQIIAMMSDRLREDIQLHNWQAMLMQVPFLNRFGDDRKSDGLLAQIASAMTESHFVQGDTIFRQGEHGDCMYFIMIGDVSAFVDGVKVGHLSCGSYFGEMALMAVIPRTATIKAATSCKCAKLHRDSLMTILINFPEIAVQMKAIFMERLAVLQAMKE
ncbi:cyclic nucleotide-binding-like protein [Chytridium lagenaria]|nr:cyclic nucleotide-binding-like protein [Chytridium lagenaria]